VEVYNVDSRDQLRLKTIEGIFGRVFIILNNLTKAQKKEFQEPKIREKKDPKRLEQIFEIK
jgi:hypothetical protein